MKCVLYVRVSTPKKVKGKMEQPDPYLQNPEVQAEPLRKLADSRGWEVAEVYSDRMSGAKSSRPGYQKLLADAARHRFGAVLVWRYDRFARSTQELIGALELFRSLGIDFVSQREGVDTSTPTGKLMFTMIAGFAEFERSVMQERIRAGIDYAVANGTKSGKAIGRPVIVFDRQKMRDMRKGGASLRDIALATGQPVTSVARALKPSPASAG